MGIARSGSCGWLESCCLLSHAKVCGIVRPLVDVLAIYSVALCLLCVSPRTFIHTYTLSLG